MYPNKAMSRAPEGKDVAHPTDAAINNFYFGHCLSRAAVARQAQESAEEPAEETSSQEQN